MVQIKLPEKEWPETPNYKKQDGKTEMVIELNGSSVTVLEPIINIERYGSWKKLLRVTTYVFRFINRLRKEKLHLFNNENHYNTLSEQEIENAEMYWLRHA